MKKLRLWLCMVILVCCLAGCGDEEATYDTTTLIVNSDGTITEVVVEAFDKEYYNASELENYAKSEVQNYNYSKVSTQISLNGVKVEEGVAKVTMTYKTDEDYREFNEAELFVGTVKAAMEEGYSFDPVFHEYGKENPVSVAKVTEESAYGIVISAQATNIVVPNKIVYISDNVTTQGKKNAVTTGDICYIIYKK